MRKDIFKLIAKFRKQKCICNGTIIPARHLRFCGDAFKDDEYFIHSAVAEAARLEDRLGLSIESSVLDIGCGYGRLPIGILKKAGEIELYQGVDVDKQAIQWCKKYLEKNHPDFKFFHVDVKNLRYNPEGNNLTSEFQFPFDNQIFNIIYLYSVFSHMVVDDIKIYLSEFGRVLSPNGKIFFTAFLEENVPDMSINPEGYRRDKWSSALLCVRYNKKYFEALLDEHGFKIDNFEYEKETHGQSAIYISAK